MSAESENSQFSLDLGEVKKKLSPSEERKMILERTEASVQEQGHDQALDKRKERRFIIEYRVHNPRSKYVRGEPQDYRPTVPMDFYEGICILKGWPIGRARRRSPIFAAYTVYLLYMRFPKEVIGELRKRNPYEVGFRHFKHFQFLTEMGYSDFQNFIQDCVKTMSECSYWDEFIRTYSKKHGLPYQTYLFSE
jgi:hypothetical protein